MELVFVIDDQNTDVQLQLLVVVGNRQRDVAGFVPISRLPKRHCVLPKWGSMASRVGILVVDRTEGGRHDLGRKSSDPEVQVQGGLLRPCCTAHAVRTNLHVAITWHVEEKTVACSTCDEWDRDVELTLL